MKTTTQQILTDGAVAGALGSVAAAVALGLLNLLTGKSVVYTAALFGSAIFYGISDPAAVSISAGPIAAFNGLHLITFLAIGMLAAWLVSLGERYPVTQYLLFALLVLLGLLIYAGAVTFALPLLGPSAWWQVGLASAAAVLLMTGYLMLRHPLLRREMHDIQWGEVAPEGTISSSGERAPEARASPPQALGPDEIDALESRVDTLSADEIRRILGSLRALQAKLDRLRRDS